MTQYELLVVYCVTVEPPYYEFLGTHEITTYYPHFVLGNEDLSVTLALPKGRSVSGDKCCRTLGWSLCQCLTQKQLPLQLKNSYLLLVYIIKKQSVQLLCLLFEKLVQKTAFDSDFRPRFSLGAQRGMCSFRVFVSVLHKNSFLFNFKISIYFLYT